MVHHEASYVADAGGTRRDRRGLLIARPYNHQAHVLIRVLGKADYLLLRASPAYLTADVLRVEALLHTLLTRLVQNCLGCLLFCRFHQGCMLSREARAVHPARYIAKLLYRARIYHVEQDKFPVTWDVRRGTLNELGGIKPAKAEQYIFRHGVTYWAGLFQYR